ncbi:c-type cytochrome biogenesis protein CcsB [Janthinobacterium sp. PC23-8]|uniref:c-type cytochrome biogenesis protein CcsB n=1 Tax=Janthinobacterium sp. PC23-8 TaxID=2012679 RepID=UPI000B966AAF|nr:c-type cytochrome biogenesis protein CcsB [Janthinobacterium sp. PC23-8]OYO31917.1 c-type cytochrome biogenesis protein CcsB [Janthinobacterium sp. PC23-8]
MELANKQIYTQEPGFFKRLGLLDWLYGAGLLAASLYGLAHFGAFMDIYEKVILLAAAPTFAWLGWYWKPVRWLIPLAAVLSLFAITLYGDQLDMANQKFFLKYMLSSQSAILWMGTFFVLSTLFYWIGLVARSDFGSSVGSLLCWAGVVLGLTGMLVRWYESYLIGADVGHIPVSNLYEVFILFSLITAMFYLYYEQHYATRQLGAFVMLVISAAVVFLLWYTVTRDAADIQPLVPALQSWWMKIHVPANFIGYGTFSLSAMVASAYLLKSHGYLVDRLPSLEVLDDVMYKAISVGFAFFTVATILGALWAAEAWGGYWSWDPKETWALIVWLNYAAWLHMRLMTGLRGKVAAWWALVGLLVTTFAFLGVNMFLSGLHSYGKL